MPPAADTHSPGIILSSRRNSGWARHDKESTAKGRVDFPNHRGTAGLFFMLRELRRVSRSGRPAQAVQQRKERHRERRGDQRIQQQSQREQRRRMIQEHSLRDRQDYLVKVEEEEN